MSDTTATSMLPASAAQTSADTLHIELVRIRNLADFAAEAFRTTPAYEALPISLARARAQAQNPTADDEDVALAAGYLGSRCVASLGILPGQFRVGRHTRRVRWASAWWASDAYRGRGFGTALLKRVLALPGPLLAAGNSDAAVRSFRRFGCRELQPLAWDNVRLQRSLCARVARRVRRSVAPNAPGRFSAPAQLTATGPGGLRYRLRRVAALSAASERAQQQHGPRVGFYRSCATINWMATHPWCSEDPQEAAPNYYFSHASGRLAFALYETRADTEHPGFVVFKLSRPDGGELAVDLLDYCFDQHADDLAGRLTLACARASGAAVVRLPANVTAHVEKDLPDGSRRRRRERTCFWWPDRAGGVFESVLANVPLGHTDGDLPFIYL